MFEIKAYIIDSGFKKFDITKESATGDLGKAISSGNNKRIEVNLSKINNIKGIYKIQINCFAYKALGGPSNAILSLIIPGLGNIPVHESPQDLGRMIIVLGAIGISAFVASEEKTKYDQYKHFASNFWAPPQSRVTDLEKAEKHK